MIEDGIDPIIHQPTRLRLMAAMVAMEPSEWVDFSTLKRELALTDGNLGAHLQSLEQANYILVNKQFMDRRPKTLLQATLQGRAAFEKHRAALRKILDGEST